jgi:ATP-dependent helicase HrpB
MDGLRDLPLVEQFEEIQKAWDNCRHLAIRSPTGSGKSIGLPTLLLQKKMVEGQIFVVQPRRIAARLLARRVAALLGCEVGSEVGYQVRFDKKYSDQTKIVYLTDGILLNKLLSDPTLSRVGLVIFDEFHERSLQIDLALALSKKLAFSQRPSLRLIVTSATLRLSAAKDYLQDCASIELKARTYPVEIEHRMPSINEPIWKQIALQLKKIIRERQGNVLIFMDGAFEISKTVREIQTATWSSGLEVRALFGDMSVTEQDLTLAHSSKRKVIVSTNIAETSLTIEGVEVVIDTGKAKKASYDQTRKVDVLLSSPISKSSAEQRAGRAGRTAPGYCLRMWTLGEHERRELFELPEIQRMDLAELYLKLRSVDICPKALNWFEKPPEASLEVARATLVKIGALSEEEDRITDLGSEVSRLGLHPRLGASLVEGKQRDCLPAVALTFAMLENRPPLAGKITPANAGDQPWLSGANFDEDSDLLVFLKAYEYAKHVRFAKEACMSAGIHALRCREAEQIAVQTCLQVGLVEFDFQFPDYDEYLKIILGAYSENLCMLKSRGTMVYETFDGRRAHLPKHSSVGPSPWVLPLRIVEKMTKGSISLEMEFVSSVREDMIREFFASEISDKEEVLLDLDSRKVVRRKYTNLGELKFSFKDSFEVSDKEVSSAYAKAIHSGDLVLKKWDSKVEAFLARVDFLHTNFPEYGIEPLDEDSKGLIFEEICTGQRSWKSIRNQEVYPFVRDAFGEDQLKILEEAVPVEIDLGNGRKPYRISYGSDHAQISATLQDLYDVSLHPCVNYGKYKLTVDILAPNGRSSQLTKDLPSFWEGSYPQVKKELAGRYPKHEWR